MELVIKVKYTVIDLFVITADDLRNYHDNAYFKKAMLCAVYTLLYLRVPPRVIHQQLGADYAFIIYARKAMNLKKSRQEMEHLCTSLGLDKIQFFNFKSESNEYKIKNSAASTANVKTGSNKCVTPRRYCNSI